MTKIRPDLIAPEMHRAMAEVLTFGLKGHGKDTWQDEPFERHYECFCRHVLEWQEGKRVDEDSGLNPLKHAYCRLGMMIAQIERGKDIEEG